jgi:hypothetical protein
MNRNSVFPDNQIFDNKRLRCDTDCSLFHRLGNPNEYDKTTQCRLCEKQDMLAIINRSTYS